MRLHASVASARLDPDEYNWDENEVQEDNQLVLFVARVGNLLQSWLGGCGRALSFLQAILAAGWRFGSAIGSVLKATWLWISVFSAELVSVAAAVLQAPAAYLSRVQRKVPVRAWMLRKNMIRMMPKSTRKVVKETFNEVSTLQDFWAKVHWLWERPVVRSVRITFSVANWGVRLPAIMAVGTAAMTQIAFLTSQVSLPMIAPLLLGAGMLLRTVKANASFLFPRIGVMLMLLWAIWFANSVVQNTWIILTRQRRIEPRLSTSLVTLTECISLLAAATVVLSMLGLNVSGLLLPAAICLAVACKDLLTNLLAGLFLFMVQPFRIGDRVSVPSTAMPPPLPTGAAGAAAPAAGAGSPWFEGTCEKVDLRYTVLRQGRWRLMVPNAMFVNREFLVLEEVPEPKGGAGVPEGGAADAGEASTTAPPALGRASVAAGAAGPIRAAQTDAYLQSGMHQPVPVYVPAAGQPVASASSNSHSNGASGEPAIPHHQDQMFINGAAAGIPVGVHNLVQPMFAGFLQTVAPPLDSHSTSSGAPHGHHVTFNGAPFNLHGAHHVISHHNSNGHVANFTITPHHSGPNSNGHAVSNGTSNASSNSSSGPAAHGSNGRPGPGSVPQAAGYVPAGAPASTVADAEASASSGHTGVDAQGSAGSQQDSGAEEVSTQAADGAAAQSQSQQQQQQQQGQDVRPAHGLPAQGLWYSFQPPAGTMYGSYFHYAPPAAAPDAAPPAYMSPPPAAGGDAAGQQ